MEELFKTQEVLCAKLAQAISNFKKTGSTRRTKSYLQNRIDQAESIWNEFNSNDITILKKTTPASKTDIRYFVDDIFNKADEMYFNYISDLGDLLEQLEKPSASLNISSNVDESSSNFNSYKPLDLPKINHLKFDGNFENWQSFNDLFMSLVHTRTDVPAVNKLHYLKTSLTGEAETLFKPFSITEANYSVAREFLNNGYNDKRILISKHLNKVINQATIKHENSTSLKNLLDVTRETLSSLNHLGVSTSQWDIIINHILTLKFPKQTLQLWEQTLSSSTDLPIYKELKTFLESKSRVAPTNTLSIPRLELCASLLLARLLQKVRQGLDSLSYEVFLWTDSEIILDWLSSHPSRWTIFVANRVSQIQELTQDIRWRHVSYKENAADILSRGATVEELLASTWYCGPTFLTKSADYWLKQKQRAINTNVPETRISYLRCLTTIQTKNYLYDIINKYSNYNKIIKIFAYIFRFIEGCRRKRYLDDHPDSKELDYSLLKIIKIIQDVHFHVEIRQLKQTQLITSQCNIKSLNPFIEHENEVQLLKVGGRLRNANIPYQAKCPILLPKNDHFVKLLISKLHVSNLHAGPQALLSILRQRFWLINGRTVVRNVVNKCIHCFHYKPKLSNQLMGDLPKSRVEPSRAFYVSGVDFCGPGLISSRSRSKSLCKAYIAVFVCFTTHAVHLELVSSLTSEAFIASLKMFTSRRGRCHTLHCDNATNFVGACKKLDDLRRKFQDQQFKNVISQWCSNQGIKFSHIPARSPHFGGIWEAAVKSAKNLLNRSLQEHHFTFEEMNTLLTQIESILNSRPISPLSSDPSDESPLTPGHFLIGGPLTAIPEFQYPPDIKISSLQRFHRLSAIQQHFWKRWSSEYILNLQIRHKWKTSASNICIGTLVLIADDSLPPQQWRLGRVVSVYPGTDGKIRVVDVQSKGKILRRQIHSLAPLPLPDV